MQTQTDGQDGPIDGDDLDEAVLEAAARIHGGILAPEASAEIAELTVWDESVNASGHRVKERPAENEETIAEQLVSAGNEEADHEQRIAAARSNMDTP